MSWDDIMPCEHCGQRKDDHMEDGKCLFEASTFKPRTLDTELKTIAMWSYTMTEPEKPKKPYPERTKFAQRKERRLQMKSQKKGRR